MSPELPFARLLRLLAGLLASCVLLTACGGRNPAPVGDDAPFVVASDVALLVAPRIAGAGSDAWVAWIEQSAGAARAVAARVNASGSVQLTPLTTTAPAAGPVQLTTVGNTVLATWFEELGAGYRMVVASWNVNRWVHEQSIAATVYGDVQIVAGPGGQVVVAWHEAIDPVGTRLRMALRDGAGSWSAPAEVRSIAGTLPGWVQMAFDNAGQLLAGWLEYVNDGSSTSDPDFALWHSILPAGGAWSLPTRLEPEKVGTFRIAGTATGSWVVVWNAGGPVDPRRLFARRLVNGAWDAAPQRVDSIDTESAREVELQSSNGVIQAAWIGRSDSTGAFSVRVARMDPSDGRWLAPTLLLQSPVVQAAAPRLLHQTDGRAAMIWNYTGGDQRPWVAISPFPGVWESATHLDAEGFDSQGADLATHQDGWVASWYRRRGPAFDIAMTRLR